MMEPDDATGYEFPPGLPVPELGPGRNLLVSGPSQAGAREIALDLVTMGSAREGIVLFAADNSGSTLLEHFMELPQPVDRSMVGIVDCSTEPTDEDNRFSAHATSIAGPGDLTNIEMEFSLLYEKLHARDTDGIRIGVLSLTSLLEHAPLRDVSRFLHMLTGRNIATGDLGVFLVDSTTQDARTIQTLSQFCDGHIEVRETDDGGLELRVTGLADHSESWSAIGYEVPSLEQENGPTDHQ